MDKRDAILAKLALSLGLIDDVGLQRAMQLKGQEPGLSFDRILFKLKLIDPAGHQRLAQAFNDRVRQARSEGSPPRGSQRPPAARPQRAGARPPAPGTPARRPAPGTPARRPAPPPKLPPQPASAGPASEALSLREPGGRLRNDESSVIHVAESGPFPSSGSYKPPADPALVSSDVQLGGESSDDVIVPVHMESSDDLTIPSEDDLQLEVPDEDEGGLRIPESDEDAVFAEPTVVLEDGDDREATEVLPDGLSPAEAAILAEPTVVLHDSDEDIKPPAAGAPEGIFAEPTVVIADGEGSEAPVDEAVFAEPTLVLSEDPAQAATAGAHKTKAPSSHELEIDVSLAASSRRHTPQAVPGVKTSGGVLDRDEFERRLKRRQDFKGFTLGDYKILGELARGAFGVVLEVEPGGVAKSMARERGYQGNLALKVMMTNTSDPRQSDRFLEEVRVLIGFDHPHIVRIFDAGVEAGLTYYSMEMVHGVETKAHVLKSGPMPPLLAVRVVKEIASALSYVHAQQIYHRDLKPQNVMLDTSVQPYRSLLIDFGLVTEAEDSKDKGLIMGTPSYMPPEQAQPRGNHGPINATSDIYSLGATMFYLLTGRAPFIGRDPRKIIQEVVNDPPPDPCELNPQIPRKIGDIVLKCLAKQQRDRYHSSRQLEAELDKELRSGRMKLKAKKILGRWFGGGNKA